VGQPYRRCRLARAWLEVEQSYAETRHQHSIAVSTALRERFQAERAVRGRITSVLTARVSSTACGRRNGRAARTGLTCTCTVESNVASGGIADIERQDLAFHWRDDDSMCTPLDSSGCHVDVIGPW
jgi:hypothetical protein